LRLSPMTRRFVRFRRTYLLRDDVETSCASQTATAGDGCKTVGGCGYFAQRRENRCRTANFTSPVQWPTWLSSRGGAAHCLWRAFVSAVLIKMQDCQLYFEKKPPMLDAGLPTLL